MASTPEQKQAWVLRNPEQARANARNGQRKYRQETLNILGRECVQCGFNDERALQVDHINGGGHKLRDQQRSQSGLLRAVAATPKIFQILCANCNCIKRIENNENRKVGQ